MAGRRTEWTTFGSPWVLVNVTDTGSGLKLSSGYTSGTATLQYEATGWRTDGWFLFQILGEILTATAYNFRFRTATTQGGLAAATYSEKIDFRDVNGTITGDLETWVENNPAWNIGPWIEVEMTLKGS